MDSPYLAKLIERRLAATTDSDVALVDSEIGIYRARLGEFAAAEDTARSIRAQFGDGRSGRVTVMLNLLEALIPFFRDLAPASRDRLQRAHLLSVAGRDRRLSALISAWMAHVDFNLHRHADMARSVRTCVETIIGEDLDAVCRLGLTLGDAYCVSGQQEVSRTWYDLARTAAVKLGDHATIAAVTGNSAALRVFTSRLRSIVDQPPLAPIALIYGEAKTALNYQAVAGLSSFSDLLQATYASALVLKGEYEQATKALEGLHGGEVRTSLVGQPVLALCDLAMCYGRTGRVQAAKQAIASIEMSRLDGCTDDDLALACSSLAMAYGSLGDEEKKQELADRSTAALQRHSAEMERLSDLLAPYRSTSELAAQI